MSHVRTSLGVDDPTQARAGPPPGALTISGTRRRRFKERVTETESRVVRLRGMSAVLVVDDEPIVLDVVTRYLEHDGHRVVTAATGDEARLKIEDECPDLVLLDVMLPGETDGLALCRWIRSTSELPVILVTARGEESDRIVGLELGADDYVTKPFSPRELATRVRTVLRRVPSTAPPRTRVAAGPLEIDAAKREVLRDGEPLQLTAREFELLWFLASNPNRVFSRDQ